MVEEFDPKRVSEKQRRVWVVTDSIGKDGANALSTDINNGLAFTTPQLRVAGSSGPGTHYICGWSLTVADYETLEIRILAQVALGTFTYTATRGVWAINNVITGGNTWVYPDIRGNTNPDGTPLDVDTFTLADVLSERGLEWVPS